MMAQVFYPSSWEARQEALWETDTSLVHTVSSRTVRAGQPGRRSETLSQKTPKSKNKNNPPCPPKENTVNSSRGTQPEAVLWPVCYTQSTSLKHGEDFL